MLLEAATIAAQAGDIVRFGAAGAGAEPDAFAFLREPQAARLGERGEAVQIRGRRGSGVPGTDILHNGNLLWAWAGAITTRPPDPVRGVHERSRTILPVTTSKCNKLDKTTST